MDGRCASSSSPATGFRAGPDSIPAGAVQKAPQQGVLGERLDLSRLVRTTVLVYIDEAWEKETDAGHEARHCRA